MHFGIWKTIFQNFFTVDPWSPRLNSGIWFQKNHRNNTFYNWRFPPENGYLGCKITDLDPVTSTFESVKSWFEGLFRLWNAFLFLFYLNLMNLSIKSSFGSQLWIEKWFNIFVLFQVLTKPILIFVLFTVRNLRPPGFS